MNCHGCKHLDRYKQDGNGYCAMVERSKTFHFQYFTNGKLIPSSRVRRPDTERCELYEAGNFETRFRSEEQEDKKK